MGSSSLASRSSDPVLTSKVKASVRRCQGRIRQRDQGHHRAQHGLPDGPRHRARGSNRAADIARVPGVQKVVKVFEVITEPSWPRSSPKQVRSKAVPNQRSRLIRLEVSPAGCRRRPGCRHRTGRPAPSPAGARRCAALLVEHRPRSLRIQSTAKPKSNLASTMVGPRLSICQLCAAPLPITPSTAFMSSPARSPKAIASARALHQPGDADLVDHLGQLAGARAQQRDGARERHRHRLHRSRTAAASPPHITVSAPLMAPGCRPTPARR